MNIDKLMEGYEMIEEGLRVFKGGPASYYLKKLLVAYKDLTEKFSPFKVGDKVFLLKTPEIPEGSGWYSCRHFLIKGASAIIDEVDYDEKGFNYYIVFDNETFIWQGKEEPVTSKHTYHFREEFLEKTKCCECCGRAK